MGLFNTSTNYVPSQEQFRTVIENLEKARRIAGHSKVRMDNGHLYHVCTTALCHGGWYAVAHNLHHRSGIATYKDGADLISEHLGVGPSRHDLTEWSYHNPQLWGNRHGHLMFNSTAPGCFGISDTPTDLQQIIDHWKGVAERCRLYEEGLKLKIELSEVVAAIKAEYELTEELV